MPHYLLGFVVLISDRFVLSLVLYSLLVSISGGRFFLSLVWYYLLSFRPARTNGTYLIFIFVEFFSIWPLNSREMEEII